MIIATIVLASALALPGPSARTTCPGVAPASWGLGRKPLESVRVISYPIKETPGPDREYYATPPWRELEKAGHIYQTWQVNGDPQNFKYEVDCVYAGTARYVRLEVTARRLCLARWRARADHGVVPRSLQFACK